MHIGFAILLSEEAENYAREVELELCSRFGVCWGLRQPPHITVKPPFETVSLEPFVAYLTDLATDVRPFSVEIQGFGKFTDPGVIFLDVKSNPHLKGLQERIRDDLGKKFGIQPKAIEGAQWKFHSSVALTDLSHDKLVTVWNSISKRKPHFEFTACTLAIFYYLGEDVGWIIIRKIQLGKK